MKERYFEIDNALALSILTIVKIYSYLVAIHTILQLSAMEAGILFLPETNGEASSGIPTTIIADTHCRQHT